MFSYNLLKQSYKTSEIITNKLRNIVCGRLELLTTENHKYDGLLWFGKKNNIKFEMKQRQDYFIKNIVDGKSDYNDFHLIATKYQKEHQEEFMIYYIYDLSMEYCLCLTSENINFERMITSHLKSKNATIEKWVCYGEAIIYDLNDNNSFIVDLSNLKNIVTINEYMEV